AALRFPPTCAASPDWSARSSWPACSTTSKCGTPALGSRREPRARPDSPEGRAPDATSHHYSGSEHSGSATWLMRSPSTDQLDGRPLLRPLPSESRSGRHPDGAGAGRGAAHEPGSGSAVNEPFEHRPVLLDEVVELFAAVPAGVVVDATVGGAGHARALL